MDDDKAVAFLSTFLLTNNEIDAHKRARDLVAAIRAEGGEVIWWQDGLGECDMLLATDVVVGIKDKHAILRGPEVKP